MPPSKLSRLIVNHSALLPLSLLALLVSVTSAIAQGPGGPPPLPPLNAPPAPAGNPTTAAKANLGKALFWDEQLSSTRTISCATCHQPSSGGADPRASIGDPISTHPGPDGILGNADDITGSPGVILNNADGTYSLDSFFGMTVQVTGRYAPSAINAGYSPTLFWDGRAGGRFTDPLTGAVLLTAGAALESQAAGPPVSDAEMAHQNRDWAEIETRVAGSRPLALAGDIPTALEIWIAGRNYPALFQEAFSTAEVTAARVAMAIAAYERTLFSNQAPFDQLIAGNPNALTAQEQLGQQIFGQARCVACHGGNRLTDDRFHYIGVRPADEDPGRAAVTGNPNDQGRMRTPSLRNASLRGAYMHNGRFGTLMEVVEFYNRGGDFDAPNKDPNIRPLNLTQAEKEALVAFLDRPLTDPRVAAETAPFDRPSLYADTDRQPQIMDNGVAGSGGHTPQLVAIEPPLAGNPSFTVGIFGALGGAEAVLVIDTAQPLSGAIPDASSVLMQFSTPLSGSGDGDGFASVSAPIPADLAGETLFGRWYVSDAGAIGGLAETAAFEITVSGSSAGLVSAPSNLFATQAADSDDTEVSWDPVANASHYQVYRGETDQFLDANLVAETADPQFTDTSTSAGDSNRFWIVAVSNTEAGPSGVSAPSVILPAGPENLTATDGASSEETIISWDPVDGANGYTVYRSTDSEPANATPVEATTETDFADTSGDAARTYFYWVTATVGGIESRWSQEDAGTRALAAPTALSATDEINTDRIVLTWTTGPDATSCQVFRNTTDDFVSATLVGNSNTGTWEDFTVTALQTYHYWVIAENTWGTSDPSASDTGVRALPAPTDLDVNTGNIEGEADLSWDSEGATSFRIYRSETNDFNSASMIGTSAETSFTDPSLDPGVSYFYWVEAVNGQTTARTEAPTVAIAGEPQPDLSIGSRIGNLRGDDLISPTGAGQRITLVGRRLRATKAFTRIQNDATLASTFRITGSPGNGRFSVSYQSLTTPVGNVTAAVRSGTYECEDLEPSASELLKIRIKPRRKTSRRRSYQLQFEAVSVLSDEFVDRGKIRAVQKP